jgi:hypothetical protein
MSFYENRAEQATANTAGVTFQGGAGRQTRKTALHLTPIELIEAVGKTRMEGDGKYGPGNWQHGSRAFFVDCMNHAIAHLFDACGMNSEAGDDEESIETHLGHAACNIAFMLWALKRQKLSREDFRNAAAVMLAERIG